MLDGLVQFFCRSSSVQTSSSKVLFSCCMVSSSLSLSEDVADDADDVDDDEDDEDVVPVVVGPSPCVRFVISMTVSLLLSSLLLTPMLPLPLSPSLMLLPTMLLLLSFSVDSSSLLSMTVMWLLLIMM